jgi:hypothetical protein
MKRGPMAYSTPIDKIAKVADEQLLVTRQQARVILGGVCYMTICRWEQEDKLHPVQLGEGVTSKIFYLRDELIAFAKSRRRPSTARN